jgi:hypothetical protein
MATGAVTATATEPLDVVKTRLMAQRRGAAAGAAASAKGAGAGGTPPVDYGYRNVAHGLVTAARSEVGPGGRRAAAAGGCDAAGRSRRAPVVGGLVRPAPRARRERTGSRARRAAPGWRIVAYRLVLPLVWPDVRRSRAALARALATNTSSAGGIDM